CITMLLCLIIWLCAGDQVQQQPGGVIATEGGLVTLSCQYNTSANNNNAYLFWYKQEENDFPKHMLTRFSFGSGDNAGGFKERFNASLNAKTQSVPLMIQRLQLSDSAVYFCSSLPTHMAYKPECTVGQKSI
uniref:Ig-like domain-containing protein n=1 Tax=Oncorhynchus kisutch TaxID=8019 RepID=A0A8C7HJF3_ONCKI